MIYHHCRRRRHCAFVSSCSGRPRRPRPRSFGVAKKEGKTWALMNQNDIGRQHRQTYNFSPSVPLALAPSLPLLPSAPPPRALDAAPLVCVRARGRASWPTEQPEFCRKSGPEILPTFQTLFVPARSLPRSRRSVQNSAITAARKRTRDADVMAPRTFPGYNLKTGAG